MRVGSNLERKGRKSFDAGPAAPAASKSSQFRLLVAYQSLLLLLKFQNLFSYSDGVLIVLTNSKPKIRYPFEIDFKFSYQVAELKECIGKLGCARNDSNGGR